MTLAEWGELGLGRGFTVIDVVAILKQIHLHTLAQQPIDTVPRAVRDLRGG